MGDFQETLMLFGARQPKFNEAEGGNLSKTISINFMKPSRGWTALQSQHLKIANSGTNTQY